MQYTVKEVKEEIKKGIRAYIEKDEHGAYCLRSTNRIPFYLEGKPGIGKTEIVRQVADELEIGFVSFSITHHTRNSLLGLPVISNLDSGKYTEYTMSEIIAAVVEKEEQGQKEGILLLDEFNCASESVMPTMLAFLQTRNIGKYCLPEGWSIVLCGNPKAYNNSARRFDAAILDRVRKMEVEYDIKDFLEYAEEKKFHRSIIEYLKVNKHNFYRYISDRDSDEVVTCRGWENLSHTLKMYEKLGQMVDEKLIYQYLKSIEIANAFSNYYFMFSGKITLKELKEIIHNMNTQKYVEIAKKEGFVFCWNLEEQLFHMILNNKPTSGAIGNVINFLKQLPYENSVLERFFQQINQSKELVEVLSKVKNEEYLNLCRKAYGELEVISQSSC